MYVCIVCRMYVCMQKKTIQQQQQGQCNYKENIAMAKDKTTTKKQTLVLEL